MKKYVPLTLLLALVISACSSSHFTTYRPAGSAQASWTITVIHKNELPDNFKVVINDSTVIDATTYSFSGNLEQKGKYDGKEIRLVITTSSGFLGFGAGYDALVFVSDELAATFKL